MHFAVGKHYFVLYVKHRNYYFLLFQTSFGVVMKMLYIIIINTIQISIYLTLLNEYTKQIFSDSYNDIFVQFHNT